MTTLHTQDRDIFEDADPGIVFDLPDETWTILTGVLVSSSADDGVFGELAFQSLFNSGAILSGAEDGAGVEMNGDNSHVSNAAGARIIGADDGVRVDGSTAVIDNQGAIFGLTGIGVDFGQESNFVTLNNSSAIFGRSTGVRAFSDFDGGVIHNAGVINSDNIGIDVFTNDGLATIIDNAAGATIRGGADAITVGNGGRILLTNRGTLIGDIEADFDDAVTDVVFNHGKISGVVSLGAGNDVFNGTGGISGAVFGEGGSDRLIGGRAADRLSGNEGLDRLAGAAGNDRLAGGLNNDTLIGGPGADQFLFDTNPDTVFNGDRIADFAVHVDKVVLDRGIFAGVGAPGVLAAAKFHIGAAAADASDRIVYNPNNGFLFYDQDGRGGHAAIHFATLAPHLDLHNTDFLVALLVI